MLKLGSRILSKFEVSLLAKNQTMYFFNPSDLEFTPEKNTFIFSIDEFDKEIFKMLTYNDEFALGEWSTVYGLQKATIQSLLFVDTSEKLANYAEVVLDNNKLENVQCRFLLNSTNKKTESDSICDFTIQIKVVAVDKIRMRRIVTDELGNIYY